MKWTPNRWPTWSNGIPNYLFSREDFLQTRLDEHLTAPYAIIGNFPYNISSQIFFRVLDERDRVPEVVGMLQKEVADRLCAPPRQQNLRQS